MSGEKFQYNGEKVTLFKRGEGGGIELGSKNLQEWEDLAEYHNVDERTIITRAIKDVMAGRTSSEFHNVIIKED